MKKVVIVEDNHVIQHILISWFADEDFQVISLEGIEDLVQKVAIFNPDLIITDIMLPNTTANEIIDVFTQIKCPVIVISSMDEEDVEYFSSRIGAIAAFNKPINIDEVFAFIREYFKDKNLTTNPLQV